jgi:type IV pilus assembly protein PilK
MNTLTCFLDKDAMASDEPDLKLIFGKQTKSARMDEQQFSQWSELLEQRTGMKLPENRVSFLTTNLNIRMRELGYVNYQEYYDYVVTGKDGLVEWNRLIDKLTVHETRFLRNSSVYEFICEMYLPQEKPLVTRTPITINAWSVGCSTGQEPYSLAMTIEQHFNKLDYEHYLGIIASDISRDAISHGREGIYSYAQLSSLDPAWLTNYFEKIDDSKYQVVQRIRQKVCFNHLNILDLGETPIGEMDIIVCQNVLIYYDRRRRLDIVNELTKYLKTDGVLMLGAGEIVNWKHPNLERLTYANTLAFRKVS